MQRDEKTDRAQEQAPAEKTAEAVTAEAPVADHAIAQPPEVAGVAPGLQPVQPQPGEIIQSVVNPPAPPVAEAAAPQPGIVQPVLIVGPATPADAATGGTVTATGPASTPAVIAPSPAQSAVAVAATGAAMPQAAAMNSEAEGETIPVPSGAEVPAASGKPAQAVAQSPIQAPQAPATQLANLALPSAATQPAVDGAETTATDKPGQAAGLPLHLPAAQGKAAPASSTESAAKPEFKIPEALQPAQGGIEFTPIPHARAVAPEALQGAQIASPATPAAAPAPTTPPTPLHVVPIEIGLRALAGGRNFDIRLEPAELGRVDVSLQISDEGEVTAKLVVDRVETLQLLQRDARTLERAFEQAGLKPSNAGVDITLRDPGDQSGFRQQRQRDEAPRRQPAPHEFSEDAGSSVHPVQTVTIRGLIRLGGVDLSI